MREPAKSFEDLPVWRKAHEFVLAVYRLTQKFHRSEHFGLSLFDKIWEPVYANGDLSECDAQADESDRR